MKNATMFKSLQTRLLAGAIAISAGISTAQAGPEDNSLVVSMYSALESVDFYLHTQREIRILQQLIEDSLFAYNSETGEIEPSLASSYEQVDDLTLNIQLREDVVFHDGSPLTADDVVYSFEAGKNPDMLNTTIQQRVWVWLDSVEKTGPHSVRLKMKYPYAFPLFDLANHMVVRQEGSISEDGQPSDEINGLGPYRLVSWNGKDVVLERFEDYFEGGPKSGATIDDIIIRNIPDWGTTQAEVLSGGVDLVYDAPFNVAKNMGKTGRVDHRWGETQGVVYIAMDPSETLNSKPNPLSKVKVRQGFNYAINKKSLIENLYGGIPRAIHTPCHPEQFGCTEDVPSYDYDPEKAQELFAEAGYPDGFDIQMWAGRDRAMVEAIAGNLIEAGVNVDLRYVNMATVEAARAEGKVPFLINDWGNTANPDIWPTLINYFGMESDRSLVHDPETEVIIQAVQDTDTVEERKEAFHEAVRHIAEQAYWVPLMTVGVHYLAHPELNFTPPTDGGAPRLYEASWD